MKIKVLKQQDGDGCGPATIKMTTEYFSLPYSWKKISKLSQYKKKGGLSNMELVTVLKKINLNIKVKHNSSWSDLKKYNNKNNVIILSWMLKGYIGHFSVLEKVTPDYIYIADPNTGNIVKMQKIIFLRLWFDYDEKWYPKKNSDIQLRWMAIINKKRGH